jgi:RNA polymerase sigma-70 factor (ECF subfamily)
MEGLVELLAEDVVFVGDGGGKATALPEPLHGAARVGHLLRAFAIRGRGLRVSIQRATINAQPGAVVRDDQGRVVNVLILDIGDGAIQAVRSIVNPDKLGHLGPVSDVARLPT